MHDKWKRYQITNHQKKALDELRQFAYQHSPFYRSFHRGLADAPLNELPVLTKTNMMNHFDDFITDKQVHLANVKSYLEKGNTERFNNKYEVVATSGSTGNPGIFLFDEREWATVIASFARAREWAGLKLNFAKRSKMAVVSSTNEKNISAKVGRAVNTRFIPTLRIDATEPIETIIAKLNEWKPEALVGYASMAYFLANEQEKGRLNIHPKFIFTA
ncbi:MAG: phenylacetate--CoA ligase family protein, partial [Bacillota bacterium]